MPPDAPDAELARLRKLVARQARDLDALAAQVARYQTVLSRALEVAAASGLVPVAARVIDGMLEVTGAQRAFLGLAREGGAWDLVVARNMARGDLPDARSQLSTTILAGVLRSSEPTVTHDAGTDAPVEPGESIVSLGLRSVACLPLNREGQTIGFVYLDDPRTTGLFDAAALTALRAWLPLAAESVARAMSEEGGGAGPLGVPTRSERMRAELENLARVAGYDVSILLTGRPLPARGGGARPGPRGCVRAGGGAHPGQATDLRVTEWRVEGEGATARGAITLQGLRGGRVVGLVVYR